MEAVIERLERIIRKLDHMEMRLNSMQAPERGPVHPIHPMYFGGPRNPRMDINVPVFGGGPYKEEEDRPGGHAYNLPTPFPFK